MSKVKINANLFMEVAELNRLVSFISDQGYKRDFLLNTKTFGLFRDINLPDIGVISTGDCFKVEKSGSPIDEITINTGIAIDSDANLIINDSVVKLTVLNNGQWFWVKIKHIYKNEEVGTVSIDTVGNVTGVGTLFTEVLRGQPNYPSNIAFTNSVNGNVNIYQVVKVVNNTTLIIAGDFTAESNLTYKVVGTFTPGYVVPSPARDIFDYDSCEVTLVPEVVPNVEPSVILNKEFHIARVFFSGTDLTIEDKRRDFWKSFADFTLGNVNRFLNNKVIGVEKICWDIKSSPKNTNEVNVAWGFRSNSYTIDPSTKKITILAGNGGKFKDTTIFTNGDFDTFRVYTSDGSWKTVVSSQASGSQIILTLDNLDIDDYGGNPEIRIMPPYEGIQIRARQNAASPGDRSLQLEMNFDFDINTAVGKIYLRVPNDGYLYNLTYRYKTFNDYTGWFNFPSDFTVGYYTEKAFDEFGDLLPAVIANNTATNQAQGYLKTYTAATDNGFIELKENINSYQNFVANVDRGDLVGVDTVLLQNANPLLNLYVGTAKQYQYYEGTAITLSADMFIIVNSTLSDLTTSLKDGNFFILHFKQIVIPTTFSLRIVDNFVNVTSYNLLKEFSGEDFKFLNESEEGIFFKVTYDLTNARWIITNLNETSFIYKKFIDVKFDVSGYNVNNAVFQPLFTFAAEAKLTNPSFILGTNVALSGAGNAGTITYKVKVNGTTVVAIGSQYIPGQSGYEVFQTLPLNYIGIITKGDTIEVGYETASTSNPYATVSNSSLTTLCNKAEY